jgi:hypothetical protein
MKLITILGCALVALAARFRGRPVAINSALSTPPINQAARAARMAALTSAGVPQLYAEKFATDATEAQAWHDNPEIRQGEQASPLTPAEQTAKAIADAHRVDTTAAPPTGDLAEREAAVAELAGKAVSDMEAARAERAAAQQTLDNAQATLAEIEAAKAKKGGK